jgi:hypothetical protein
VGELRRAGLRRRRGDHDAAPRRGRCVTSGAWLDGATWARLLGTLALEAGLPVLPLPEGVRLSRHAGRPCCRTSAPSRCRSTCGPIGGPLVEVPGVDVAWVDLPEADGGPPATTDAR